MLRAYLHFAKTLRGLFGSFPKYLMVSEVVDFDLLILHKFPTAAVI